MYGIYLSCSVFATVLADLPKISRVASFFCQKVMLGLFSAKQQTCKCYS